MKKVQFKYSIAELRKSKKSNTKIVALTRSKHRTIKQCGIQIAKTAKALTLCS